MGRPKILLTNDDGIESPGLKQLAMALENVADLMIFAPHGEKSASGLSITLKEPLGIKEGVWDGPHQAWWVKGTPADCVKVGLAHYLDAKPDLIVSGINHGSNAGRNLLYSGTVGGVIEGIMHDIPGIAFSMGDYSNPQFDRCNNYIEKIVSHVLNEPLPKGTLLNVNFPRKTFEKYQGLKFTRQGWGMWTSNIDKRSHPTDGDFCHRVSIREIQEAEFDDTDTWWLQHGFITATPIHIAELTDHRLLIERKEIFEALF
jgi:5'-nucleotidase